MKNAAIVIYDVVHNKIRRSNGSAIASVQVELVLDLKDLTNGIVE